jgi:hypothetical protein
VSKRSKIVACRLLMILAILLAAAYVADYLSLRWQIPPRPQFGTVTIQPYYAVPQKNGRTQYLLNPPQTETCVHSLFPHFGDSPCWYLVRHKEQRINL